jgi:hypothetical protein
MSRSRRRASACASADSLRPREIGGTLDHLGATRACERGDLGVVGRDVERLDLLAAPRMLERVHEQRLAADRQQVLARDALAAAAGGHDGDRTWIGHVGAPSYGIGTGVQNVSSFVLRRDA